MGTITSEGLKGRLAAKVSLCWTRPCGSDRQDSIVPCCVHPCTADNSCDRPASLAPGMGNHLARYDHRATRGMLEWDPCMSTTFSPGKRLEKSTGVAASYSQNHRPSMNKNLPPPGVTSTAHSCCCTGVRPEFAPASNAQPPPHLENACGRPVSPCPNVLKVVVADGLRSGHVATNTRTTRLSIWPTFLHTCQSPVCDQNPLDAGGQWCRLCTDHNLPRVGWGGSEAGIDLE